MPNSDQLHHLMFEVNASHVHLNRLMTIVSSAHNAHGVDDETLPGAIDLHTHGRSAQRDHEPEDGKMNELEIPGDTGPDEHVNLATDNLVTVEGESKSPEALLPEEKKEDDEEDISRAVEDALA
jgi:hypothetical protein